MGRLKILLAATACLALYITYCDTCEVCKKTVWIWQDYKIRLRDHPLTICYEHEECAQKRKAH